jgi:hypothetical protein
MNTSRCCVLLCSDELPLMPTYPQAGLFFSISLSFSGGSKSLPDMDKMDLKLRFAGLRLRFAGLKLRFAGLKLRFAGLPT